MTDNNHTFHELINAVDDIKEKISDNQYKHLVETIGLLKKKEKKFVRVKYIKTEITYPDIDCDCCDGDPYLTNKTIEEIFLINEEAENSYLYDHVKEITNEFLAKWDHTKVHRVGDICTLFLLNYELL